MTSLFSVLLPLFYLLILMYIIGRFDYFRKSGFSAKALNIAFLIKVFSGVVVFFIYSLYYPVRIEADTFRYFDDSQFMFDAIQSNPIDFFKMFSGVDCDNEYFNQNYFNKMNNWFRPYDDGLFNDNRLIIRLNALFRFFSFGNYHVHSLFVNFLSFIGLVELGKFLMKFKFSKLKIYFVLFLIPSFVFWSSGILKETILVSLLGILLNQTHEFFNEKKSLIKLFIILCCVLLMSVLKVYVLVCFLPLIAYLILQKFLIFKQRNYLPLLLCIGILTIILIVFREINPVNLIVNKQHNFINLAESIDARSKIDIPYLDGSFWNLVQAVPIAFINTSFRPFPMDLNSLMIVLPFLENVFLILLIIVFITQKRTTVFYQNQKILCIYFGLVIFFLFSLIGLTTPIIGAIVRYKVPVLPFLYIIVLSVIDFNAFSRFSLYQKLKIKIAKYL